jgi:N utilization substance protein A
MNSDLLAVLDYMEREKGIKREVLLEALSRALLTAAKKSVGPARDLRITINPRSGEITALANLIVVDEIKSVHDEIVLARARKVLAALPPRRRARPSCRASVRPSAS